MAIVTTKDSIDLGIVVEDLPRALAFYRDTLGLEDEGQLPMGGGSLMHRLRCGSSVIKLVWFPEAPAAKAPPGGIQGATGYRYWTISLPDVAALASRCEEAGYRVVIPPREIRAGVRIAMVEDPEGNWVEFLETA